jgi:preprotein translocase subunit YajC
LAIFAVIVVLGLLMWMLLIRPQRRRQLVQDQLLNSLEPGDEVVTAGGLYGVVEGVEDAEVLLEIAPGTTVRVAKRAIAGVVEEEEEEEADEELEDAEDGDEPIAATLPEPQAPADPAPDAEPSTAEQRS